MAMKDPPVELFNFLCNVKTLLMTKYDEDTVNKAIMAWALVEYGFTLPEERG